ncbi:Protection of telomeres 1 [Hyphodiscus hymeniophilus]|uniref:Protection of telomeres protein 1 n=1 Tax=Hyphodiscus hymeniophilus TaxID=353542 RepID=A0A9P6VJY6_9HELO|nr:Protection of telomeres 1 [Hyphodiscus hymeniophilus]
MESSQISDPRPSPDIVLPPGFLSVKQIQELPSTALKNGNLINVLGFVKDFQPPFKTSGTDFKCTFQILDFSSRDESSGLKITIFWPQDHMPKFAAGDAVLAQMWDGFPSLLTNYVTEIHILSTSQIPASLSGITKVPWRSHPPNKALKAPTLSETSYVVDANQHVADLALPSTMEFQHRSEQAMNIKGKYALLKDIKTGTYYNLLGEAVKIYDAPSGQLTLHLTDYTANSQFYDHIWGGGDSTAARDGDELNYLKSHRKPVSNWSGPYGKLSIQLTLFDEHASFAREQVKTGDWVLLKNVRIAYGKIGGCLEGYLHYDEGKVNVEIIESAENIEDNDPRWKAAVTRKLEWKVKFEKQKSQIQDTTSAGKRKREDEPLKQNAKARRKEKRAGVEGKAATKEEKLRARLDLNENIRCEKPEHPAVLLTDILKPRIIVDPKDPSREYHAPFDIRKCKANVRVVGFFPRKVEDFAIGRRRSDFDILSDYSGGEDTDPEETMQAFRSGKGFADRSWEWRFALQVVDASDKSFKERTWLLVNNFDAQMLLDMDATNLRRDTAALQEVKERLCILWGDLEEQTAALDQLKTPKRQTSVESKSPPPSSYKPGDQPPLDSDDEKEDEDTGNNSRSKSSHPTIALSEGDANSGLVDPKNTNLDPKSPAQVQFRNKAFTCCIKQYGVKIREEDPALANAGDGKRWMRKLGLFGTKIM